MSTNDGAYDGGDTLIQGSVTPVGGVLTFTTNFTPDTGGTNYLVRATVANLVGGDATAFSVGMADIDEVESVVESGSISNASHVQNSDTFEYRRSITIKALMTSSVAACSSNLSSFPLLVSRTDDTLKSVTYGGHVYSSAGYDIIFRAADERTQLDHEIKRYDEVNGCKFFIREGQGKLRFP